jgi:hypothetical protein
MSKSQLGNALLVPGGGGSSRCCPEIVPIHIRTCIESGFTHEWSWAAWWQATLTTSWAVLRLSYPYVISFQYQEERFPNLMIISWPPLVRVLPSLLAAPCPSLVGPLTFSYLSDATDSERHHREAQRRARGLGESESNATRKCVRNANYTAKEGVRTDSPRRKKTLVAPQPSVMQSSSIGPATRLVRSERIPLCLLSLLISSDPRSACFRLRRLGPAEQRF